MKHSDKEDSALRPCDRRSTRYLIAPPQDRLSAMRSWSRYFAAPTTPRWVLPAGPTATRGLPRVRDDGFSVRAKLDRRQDSVAGSRSRHGRKDAAANAPMIGGEKPGLAAAGRVPAEPIVPGMVESDSIRSEPNPQAPPGAEVAPPARSIAPGVPPGVDGTLRRPFTGDGAGREPRPRQAEGDGRAPGRGESAPCRATEDPAGGTGAWLRDLNARSRAVDEEPDEEAV
jgi:hypothetical protein